MILRAALMMRLSLVLLSLLVVVSTSWAQSDLPYQLRVPTADEYLAAVPVILIQAESDYSTDIWSQPYHDLIDMTWAELRHYGPLSERPYEKLKAVHSYYRDSFFGGISEDLFAAWLRENNINLDDFGAENPLTFDDFIIKVTPRDFNADGQHEWALEINHTDQYQWREVLQAVAPGGYQRIETPLFTFDTAASYTRPSVDQELAFEDLNQDGLPEWVIALGGGGGNPDYGHLVILQWQNGQLVDLVPNLAIRYFALGGAGDPVFPYGITVDLKDTDHSGTIDVEVRQKEQYDNLGCTWTNVRVFGWSGQDYTLFKETREYDPITSCAWRAAETAMWGGDYGAAISNYARAAGLPKSQGIMGGYNHELWEYEQVRWALAYALISQSDEAQKILDNLHAVGMQSATVQQMHEILGHMIARNASAGDICQAMYDLWQGYLEDAGRLYEQYKEAYKDQYPPEPVYVSYEDVINLNAYIGYIDENYPMPNFLGFALPQPEKAGCDISAYGGSLVSESAVPAESTVHKSPAPPMRMPSPGVELLGSAPINWQMVSYVYERGENQRALILARFYLMQVQQGIAKGDEWMARYLFATALRVNNRNEEALEQYVYIYEHSPLKSWRQLANLYLQPIIPLVE